jgi:acyl carrier protein
VSELAGDLAADQEREKVKDRIREFIVRSGRLSGLDDDTEIFRVGYFSSLFALQLVAFVESEFAIEIRSEDLEIHNFSSVNAMARMVCARAGADSGNG